MWIQIGVRVRKRLSWVLTSVTLTFDLWPWPFAWTSLLSMVITPENFMMIRWWEHGEKGVTDGQTDGQTDRQTDGLNQSYSCLVAAKKVGEIIPYLAEVHNNCYSYDKLFPLSVCGRLSLKYVFLDLLVMFSFKTLCILPINQCLKLMVAQSPLETKNWAGPVSFDPGQVKIIIEYIRRKIFSAFLGD